MASREANGAGALPNLIVIGTGRCGTTALHRYLRVHPEIAMSATKELNFFSGGIEPASEPALSDPVDLALIEIRRGTWSKGLDWYRAQFDPASPVRGESSPSYSSPWYNRRCAERIADQLPDVRLIFCVRDPVERTISHYRWNRNRGLERRSIDQALAPGGYYAQASRLALRLEPFLTVFGEERILILDSDDIDHRRRETLRQAFRFLDVDEDFWNEAMEMRRTPGRGATRGRIMRRLAALPGGAAPRRLRPGRWASPERRRGLTRAAERPPAPSEAVRERLAAVLAPDAARLRELTAREFAHWSV